MPIVNIVKSSEVKRTSRVLQLEGLFDIPKKARNEVSWQVELPIEDIKWNIGLIVGASGSGKSTIARHLFEDNIVSGFDWDTDRSILDGFPAEMGIKDITELLSSVGFSSPPSWLRPFQVLSNGEQFRVTIARALAEYPDLAVIDEFSSVVDRNVAQICSCAIAKAVRKRKQKIIAVTCHYDVIDWLQPDWIYDPSINKLARGCLQRPKLQITIKRVHHCAWKLFRDYHYLDADLNKASHCYVGIYEGNPIVFLAVLPFPHPKKPGWREHRLVCLPDYQGVGFGSRVSEFVAGMYAATGKQYRSRTGNPSLIKSRARSSCWEMIEKPTISASFSKSSSVPHWKTAGNRLTARFRFVGKPLTQEAQNFGLISYRDSPY